MYEFAEQLSTPWAIVEVAMQRDRCSQDFAMPMTWFGTRRRWVWLRLQDKATGGRCERNSRKMKQNTSSIGKNGRRVLRPSKLVRRPKLPRTSSYEGHLL